MPGALGGYESDGGGLGEGDDVGLAQELGRVVVDVGHGDDHGDRLPLAGGEDGAGHLGEDILKVA